MNWLILILAGLCEVGFTICLGKAKEGSGINLLWWITGLVIFLAASIILLYHAVQTLPIGTAYAVWTGIGVIGTIIAGIAIFGEAVSIMRIVLILGLISCVIGLKVIT